MPHEHRNETQAIRAWRRPDDRVAVRNHIIIMALDNFSTAVCETIARSVKGILPLSADYLRFQYHYGCDVRLRTLIGIGSNPNVAAALVISADRSLAKKVADGVVKQKKPAMEFDASDGSVVEKASKIAQEYVQWAATLRREKASLADLWISTKCDESDATTGLASCPMIGSMFDSLIPRGIYGVFGEAPELVAVRQLVADRAANREAREEWLRVCQFYGREIRQIRQDMRYIQPTTENIASGITTAEEKALGSLEKIGHLCRYIDVLEPAEQPTKGPGLYYMNTSSETECALFMAAAGYVIHTLASGRGNILGNDIVPVIQISANPKTLRTIPAHIDIDATSLLRCEMSVQQAGDALIDMIHRTADGRLTVAEGRSVGSERMGLSR
jgi:(2R)-sulfolactate sulfo-lyase subunit beta